MTWHLGVLGVALVVLAGLDAPLALLALGLLTFNHGIALQPELLPFAHGWSLTIIALLAILQAFANLYFVPIRVRDGQYLAPLRMGNAHLHARLQSLLRPLVAALIVAAVPTPLPVQPLAVACFFGGTAVYWFSAWVREYVAIARGALVLMLLEMTKHLLLLLVVVLLLWSPLLALSALAVLAGLTAAWTGRLQRESPHVPSYGGASVADDA
ncbi:MAG: hypothetical protein H0X37_00920 [Herpetosiphonaceae bacterium]|nr:hypothetical protein [Herpetosiphonaceae bacterium]